VGQRPKCSIVSLLRVSAHGRLVFKELYVVLFDVPKDVIMSIGLL